MKRILVIDGQGGKMGASLVSRLVAEIPAEHEIIAVGTNSAATAAMLKAGAASAATGENPVLVCCNKADVILGPIGILVAHALLGEITVKMAAAVAMSEAEKILLPVSRCSVWVAGVADLPYGEYVTEAVNKTKEIIMR